MRYWKLSLILITPALCCGVLGLTSNASTGYGSTPDATPVLLYFDDSATATPVETATPVPYGGLVLGPPDVCYTHACDDYGNGGTSTTSKAKRTYPYTVTQIRYTRNGTPYVYTRVVTAPPVKATITP